MQSRTVTLILPSHSGKVNSTRSQTVSHWLKKVEGDLKIIMFLKDTSGDVDRSRRFSLNYGTYLWRCDPGDYLLIMMEMRSRRLNISTTQSASKLCQGITDPRDSPSTSGDVDRFRRFSLDYGTYQWIYDVDKSRRFSIDYDGDEIKKIKYL